MSVATTDERADALAKAVSDLCAEHGCNCYTFTLALQAGPAVVTRTKWWGDYLPLKGLNAMQNEQLDRHFIGPHKPTVLNS